MGHRLISHVNVALVLGVLQFLLTFSVARRFTRYSREVLDPLAAQIAADADRRANAGAGAGGPR